MEDPAWLLFAVLFRWVMLGLGIIYLTTEASIAALPRVLLTRGSPFRTTLFYCPACTGFWVGCAMVAVWPFSILDAGPWPFVASAIESGFAMMVVGAAWVTWRGGNPAYEIEAPLRGEELLHDEPKETEDVE